MRTGGELREFDADASSQQYLGLSNAYYPNRGYFVRYTQEDHGLVWNKSLVKPLPNALRQGSLR